MTRMTFEMVAAEGKRLSQSLDLKERLVADPNTIKVQADVIKHNGNLQAERLRQMTVALTMECSGCAHPRTSHDKGMAHCGEGQVHNGVASHCSCPAWTVEL